MPQAHHREMVKNPDGIEKSQHIPHSKRHVFQVVHAVPEETRREEHHQNCHQPTQPASPTQTQQPDCQYTGCPDKSPEKVAQFIVIVHVKPTANGSRDDLHRIAVQMQCRLRLVQCSLVPFSKVIQNITGMPMVDKLITRHSVVFADVGHEDKSETGKANQQQPEHHVALHAVWLPEQVTEKQAGEQIPCWKFPRIIPPKHPFVHLSNCFICHICIQSGKFESTYFLQTVSNACQYTPA